MLSPLITDQLCKSLWSQMIAFCHLQKGGTDLVPDSFPHSVPILQRAIGQPQSVACVFPQLGGQKYNGFRPQKFRLASRKNLSISLLFRGAKSLHLKVLQNEAKLRIFCAGRGTRESASCIP